MEDGSSDGDEAGWIGNDTGEGGADKSAAYLSSPVFQKFEEDISLERAQLETY